MPSAGLTNALTSYLERRRDAAFRQGGRALGRLRRSSCDVRQGCRFLCVAHARTVACILVGRGGAAN